MKLKDAVKKAVKERDIPEIGNIVEFMRFKLGFNYDDCFAFFNKQTSISQNDFEDLMYEADEE